MTMMRTVLGGGMGIGALVAGCGTGVSSDPISEVTVAPCTKDCLASAPRVALAGVLGSGALASADVNDGVYLAVVRDPDDANIAHLVKRRPGEDTTTELDHMPIQDGAAQVLPGGDGLVWGFGGHGSDPGAFRMVGDAGAAAIAFGGRAPSFLLHQGKGSLDYTSTRDCAIEKLDLSTGAAIHTGDVGCSTRVESVLLSGFYAILRTSDSSGHSIQQMDTVFPGIFDTLMGGLAAVTDPFPGTDFGVFPPRAMWIGRNDQGDSPVYRAQTDIDPAPVDAIDTIPGPVDAATLINGELWGATVGTPSTLFHVKNSGLVRYQVGYTPRKLIGLPGLLVVQTEDGGLIEQPIGDIE